MAIHKFKAVHSGGQTGADLGGLIAAKRYGIQTGGWMPRYFRSQSGLHPEYAELYNLKEHAKYDYPSRTRQNVLETDGTIRIATNFNSPGEILTLKFIKQLNKPYFDVDPYTVYIDSMIDWLKSNWIYTLNVAGNSEFTSRGIQEFTIGFMSLIFEDCGYSEAEF